MPCECTVPLVRISDVPGSSAEDALQIEVTCPSCGAFNHVAGFTGQSDEEMRKILWNPPPDVAARIVAALSGRR